MKQKVFLFNPNRCLGCKACQVACAVNHNLPSGVFLRKVELVEYLRGSQIIKYYVATTCNHCANPECFRLCPERAFSKRRDGIVVYDVTKCTGCGICIRSCPFEAPVINPLNGKVIKCDRCYGKIENDENPYCIAACPVDALKIIYTDEVDTINLDIRRTLPGLPRIQITQPLVRYVATVMGRQIFRDNSYQDGGDRE